MPKKTTPFTSPEIAMADAAVRIAEDRERAAGIRFRNAIAGRYQPAIEAAGKELSESRTELTRAEAAFNAAIGYRIPPPMTLDWTKSTITQLKGLAACMEFGTWLKAEIIGDKVIVRHVNHCFRDGQCDVGSKKLYRKLEKQPAKGRYVYLVHPGGEAVYRL